MDYVVGSVAALISGNVTPNRPKLVRRALTPIKHQQSPNVTPKSELVDDRSIFLSPTLQKKKAIVKKSPKRIFENPDFDVTSENENNSNPPSPKADKVKKHLNEELEADSSNNKSLNVTKSSKKKRNKSAQASPPRTAPELESPQSANENTPKKQKKRKISEETNKSNPTDSNNTTEKSIKKSKKLSVSEESVPEVSEEIENKNNETPKKKKKKSKVPQQVQGDEITESQTQSTETEVVKSPKKKNKKRKNKSKDKNKDLPSTSVDENEEDVNKNEDIDHETETLTSEKPKKSKKKNKGENFVNPNAITDKDTDSEHESDNEIVSDNEEENKEVLDTGPVDESSDEEEESKEPKKKVNTEQKEETRSEDEVQRTLFVGNVPFSKKCKKEIKKIFSKYGNIETVRIRTVPVKDARVTPKMAVIKSELHPDRTTVNVYIKFKDASSVEQALSENNTVLEGRHLRVSRSASSGAEHDPARAVFVGNVPFALEDDALRDIFANCGEILSVRIVRDKKTNAGKGFGYVNFASKDGVELALALSDEDLTIKNRIMRVKRSMPGNKKGQSSGQNKNSQGKNFQARSPGRNMQNRNQFGKRGGNFGQRQGQSDAGVGEGAVRRLMHKRKNQEGTDGPPNKRQKNLNQPQKEKKTRKEFVGMTAEKKKKTKFDKGQKKKKALSEILTKYS